MKFLGPKNEVFLCSELTSKQSFALESSDSGEFSILWNIEGRACLKLDGESLALEENQLLFLSYEHKIEVQSIQSFKLIRFNTEFYSLQKDDLGIGIKGLLFSGFTETPILTIPVEKLGRMHLIWEMFRTETKAHEALQHEVLSTLFKRFLLLSKTTFLKQAELTESTNELNLIREFHYLVNSHFKKLHKVSDYAELLYKSPKTLSNVFAQHFQKSPLQVIRDRKLIEAKRQLIYSNQKISDIAFDLGYDDIQSFSRFFKSQAEVSPKDYREKILSDCKDLKDQLCLN